MFVSYFQLSSKVKSLFLLVIVSVIATGSVHANNRPELLPIPTQSIVPGQAFVYRLSASDKDGQIPSLRILNLPENASFSDNGDGSRTFSWRPSQTVANETVVIIQAVDAQDPGLISTQRMVLRRSGSSGNNEVRNEPDNGGNQNRRPTLPGIGNQLLTVGQDYQLYIRPSDEDGTVPGLAAASLPAGASLNDAFDGSRELKWRPTADQAGEHLIVFRATDAVDASLTAERSIKFIVRSVGSNGQSETNPAVGNNQPYFEALSDVQTSAGQRVQFNVVPRMPDMSAAILHIDRLPKNASFADNYNGTRTFVWDTNNADEGTHTFRFTAIHPNNVNQRVSKEVKVIVGDPGASTTQPGSQSGSNAAPQILPIEEQTVLVNKDLRFRVVATASNSSVPSLNLENAPSNARFEDNADGSREFYWTPSNAQSGVYRFNVVAKDQQNPSLVTKREVVINVVNTNDNNGAPPPNNNYASIRPANNAEAARFLQRASYGPNKQSLKKLRQQTYGDWINDQMYVGHTKYLDKVDSVLREYGLLSITDGRRQFDRQQIRSDAFWQIAHEAPDQLRQRVAFALGQILVVSDKDAGLDNRVRGIAHYHDLLASEAFGNYRTLLGKVTLNPMMGDFLSMRRNEKPNTEKNIQSDENYAREFMQLFTLGLTRLQNNGEPVIGANGQAEPTYSQDDVTNLARVFTGWNYGDAGSMQSDYRSYQSEVMPMKAFDAFHDQNEKVIVGGVKIPAGMSAQAELDFALDVVFNHANVPPFVSRQLIQRLVTSNPSPAYIDRVANVFANNGKGVRGDLAAVVRAILLDEEALYGHENQRWSFGKLKEPVIKIASIWRAFEAKGQFGRLRYSGIDSDSSQNPYSAPSVFNFYSPKYKPPGAVANEGKVAPEAQILHDTTVLRGADRLFDYAHQTPLGISKNSNQHTIYLNIDEEKGIANDVVALVEHLSQKLLAGAMSDNLRATLVELGNATPMTNNGEQRVREILYILFISPEFAVQR